MRDLDPHVAESSETDDADRPASSGTPMAQRGVGCDAGAEEGGDARQILLVVPDVQDKGLLDDDRPRIAAEGIFAAEHRTVVGSGETAFTVLLFTLMAGMAMPTTVDHATDARQITDLEAANAIADGDHATNDFVPGNTGILGVVPLAANRVEIRMANAAIQNLDLHILRARVAAVQFKGCQRARAALGCVCFGLDHG
ncbi:MAG: hypothetical protein AW07_01990 [Candidatus Accumulibacter sp. SK-11]|nr:MAG: hypothetical protein AW07_01990 [Candidatus Accumulibacter sp. SK-11]